ncbi:hypothetical protein EBS43_08520 [bacterium]|nr:hypothetical protein [bacterium]
MNAKIYQHLLIGTLLGSSTIACHVKPAYAPRSEIQAQEYQQFPQQSLRFPSNKLFLWPEQTSMPLIARVMQISARMEALESSLAPLNERHALIREQAQQIQDQVNEKRGLLTSKTRQLNRANVALQNKNILIEQKRAEINDETTREVRNELRIQELQSELAQLQEELSTLQTQIQSYTAQITQLQQEIRSLSTDPRLGEEDQIANQIRENEDEGRRNTQEVISLVEWYHQQPTSISFEPKPDGTTKVFISGWTLDRNEGARDFSSEAGPGLQPTITNIRYSTQGGIYEFDVLVYHDMQQTQLKETYSFRLARVKYSSPQDKIYLSGKMKRTRIRNDGTLEVRQGVAKLVNSNN